MLVFYWKVQEFLSAFNIKNNIQGQYYYNISGMLDLTFIAEAFEAVVFVYWLSLYFGSNFGISRHFLESGPESGYMITRGHTS